MGVSKLSTTLFFSLTIYLLVNQHRQHAYAAPSLATNSENTHRSRSRPFVRLANRPLNAYLRMKPEINDFIDDDEFYELNKRQASDDYGHLRFGKRDEFDDYGHMRFGRSSPDSSKK